jgi:Tol biopolymer transport system component
MRLTLIVIALLSLAACLTTQTAGASTLRPIVYSKVSWEWTGPEGERHTVTRGGLFATANGVQRQLTDHPGDHEPSVSRGGATIVFVRAGDLYAMAADGSGRRQLTAGDEVDERPQISPNDSYVLFVRRASREAPGDLYTVSLGGGEPKALAPSPQEDGEASFSADGRAIVFVRTLPVRDSVRDNEEVFSVRPNGDGLTRLTRTPEDELHPHFYARGIVFNRRKTAKGGPAAIYVMRRDGSDTRVVLAGRLGTPIQAVSPNGRLLVFGLLARGTWRKRLIGPTPRSLRPHRLTATNSEYLVFSPDGRRIAGAFTNTSSEVAPFSYLSSIDVFTGRGRGEGETWEAEAPGPVQTSVDPRIAW